ncbi:MAG: hypothetical protein ACRELB_02395, partial [Polyangiaceae bacterium]
MEFLALAACSEFPNDNPALHGGAIWVGATLGEPHCETRLAGEAPPAADGPVSEEPVVIEAVAAEREPATNPTPPAIEADDESDDIEIVDEIAIDDPIEESPAPVEVEPLPAVAAEPLPAVEPPHALDAFALFVDAVEGVARGAGATEASMTALAVLLGRARLDASATEADRTLRAQALAWQGILRGE